MPIEDDADAADIVDARDAAESAGLLYVDTDGPGISRIKEGDGFAYQDARGRPVVAPAVLERIRHLAIPPAYTDVWISPKANGHIQATGRDAKGRKQYRYHPKFREVRDSTKFEHLMAFAAALPTIRAAIAKHMALRGLPREKVLATVVYLLENTLIRVGNDDYARTNDSYGLTTLKPDHVAVEGSALHFEFKGKSNKMWRLDFRNKRVASIVKACEELPGQHLFQYVDHDGQRHAVHSGDVNDYLREIAGRDVTAKDFRTWAGTVLAALALHEFGTIDSQAAGKKNVRAAIERVSARLGNTPTICRKCYVHPEVFNSYLAGELLLEIRQEIESELREELPTLRPEEAAVLALLESRINQAIIHGQPPRP